MFTAVNTITCPAASAEYIERAFAAAANLQGVPGFLGSRLLRNLGTDDPVEFQAIFEWESRAALETWRKGESFRQTGPVTARPGLPTVKTETYETPA